MSYFVLLSSIVTLSLLSIINAAFTAFLTFVTAIPSLPRHPLIALRNRIARTRNGRLTLRHVVLIGPFEIGLGRLPVWHPQFPAGAHVIAYFPSTSHF